MTTTELPYRATTDEACAWLAARSGTPWNLAALLAQAITPYVWLDYDAAHAALFGDANGGYAAPIFYEEDIARLAAGSEDVLITMTKDAYKIVARLPAPGFRLPLAALRFQKKDLERLAARLEREARPQPVKVLAATESRSGIGREQVLQAFAGAVRFDLAKALDEAGGIFGDEGARVKGSAARTRNKALWNPVTLALGLNEVYRVPLSQLKRAFHQQPFLDAWSAQWERSIALLGK